MADNTIFDSVFKTMVHKMPRLMIPFINEVFGRQYPQDAELEQFNSEHSTPHGPRFDDSVFRVQDKLYHVECQSTADAGMAVRMIEYDFHIALERALQDGAPYRMEFPASCVLFLRHKPSTPDVLAIEVVLPDGHSFDYQAKVMKAQLYGKDEIFQKRLLLLLPYYLMRYEGTLAQIDADDERTMRLVAECTDLRLQLAEATLERGEALLYQELTELIIKISDYLTEAFDLLQKRVRTAMGGEVLELLHERAERMEREAEERGLERGLERGIDDLSEKLLELGVDEKLLEQAKSALKEEKDD